MENTAPERRDEFPWPSLLIAVLAGFPALALGLAAALFAHGIDGGPDDVIIEFNGHHVGGTMDTTIALSTALLFGAAGVFLLVRVWSDISAWRRLLNAARPGPHGPDLPPQRLCRGKGNAGRASLTDGQRTIERAIDRTTEVHHHDVRR